MSRRIYIIHIFSALRFRTAIQPVTLLSLDSAKNYQNNEAQVAIRTWSPEPAAIHQDDALGFEPEIKKSELLNEKPKFYLTFD
jgi:hypothetical protein